MAELSKDYTKGTHTAGEEVMFAPGGYDIACLSAGGAIAAVDAVMAGRCANAYALLRPPGHHAEADAALGFCMFNNIAVAARHARDRYGLQRIAIVDWDVHHGNGAQGGVARAPDVLRVLRTSARVRVPSWHRCSTGGMPKWVRSAPSNIAPSNIAPSANRHTF